MPEPQSIGQNVNAQVDGDTLTLTVNLKEAGTPSASGKSQVIASTRGNTQVNGVSIGLNVYRKRS